MSILLEISSKLQDTYAAIAKIERVISENPSSRSLQIEAKSLRKRQCVLESEFHAVAEEKGVDICSYRLLTGERTTTISALSDALSDFQLMVSRVFDAIKNGPKERAKLSTDVIEATAFRFGYAFSGSTGIVLTIDRELVLGDTDIDKSIDTIFSVAKAKSPEDVLKHKKTLGIPPIKSVYAWANNLASEGLGADIQWRKGESVQSSLLMQSLEFDTLRSIIEKTSEETVKEFTTRVELLGANVDNRSFLMRLIKEGTKIRGSFTDAIDEVHRAEVPRYYTATLRVTKKTVYSTEEDDVSYYLVSLETAEENSA